MTSEVRSRNQKSEVRTRESGVGSQESGVRTLNSSLREVKHGALSRRRSTSLRGATHRHCVWMRRSNLIEILIFMPEGMLQRSSLDLRQNFKFHSAEGKFEILSCIDLLTFFNAPLKASVASSWDNEL